jgi:uncharacterized SAM-binding protein YcdF (DUF218 family)
MTRSRRAILIIRALIIIVVVIVAVPGVAAIPLFIFPAHSAPARSDALLVLGPTKDRLPLARTLMDEGFSSTLVVVSPVLDNGRFEVDICNNSSAVSYEVVCFSAVPATTRGEARGLATLAEARGWNSVMVLTATPHLTRAQVIIARCFPGDIRMIEYRPDLELNEWAYQVLYQYGGFAKVLSESGC